MSTQDLPGVSSSGASPHDTATRLEEENYLQYTRQQYNTIQANLLMAGLQRQAAIMQMQEAEDTQPPQDPEQRMLWRAQTLHGGLDPMRFNRRIAADPDETLIAAANRANEQRLIYDQFYARGKQHAAAKFHAGASLPDKLARATMLAGDDARLMYDEATAFSEGQQYVGPPGVQSAIFGMVRGLMPQRSEYAQPPVTTGGPGALSPQERRDLAFQAMQEGYGETVHQATGSRKVAIQALETIGSMIPYVAAAPALPGGIVGAAATGAGLGAIEKLSGEDMQAVDRERERGGDPGKMEAQLRSLRAVQGAVSWGMMGLGAKAGVGNTVAGRLKQAAGMHMGTEAGAMAADATRGVHESITGRDPGAQSAILKAAHALSDPSLTEEQRRDALLEAGTHFGVGLATFAAVHVATGLKELAPRTMARPENAKVVADLEREARADLRKQDMEPGVVGQVLPSAEKAVVTIDTRPPETPTMKGKAELSGDLSAPMPPEPHITPPGPPPRLSKAEREAMGDVLAPGTKFKLHESVTIGGGGDLEVVRNEVGAKGVIQVKTEAGKTIDFTPDMLDLVLPESIREGGPQVIAGVSPEKTRTIGPVSGAESDTQRERGDRHGVPQAAPAAEPTKEPTEAAPTQPARFVTAKGSTYEYSGGATTRNKAARPEHPGEEGPQPRSDRTYFVSPADIEKLARIQASGGPRAEIAEAGGGKIGVRYLEGDGAGKFERDTLIPYEAGPRVGLSPVEVWKGKTPHFGNPITEVTPGEAERLSPGLVRGTITPTAEGTVPAFSRAGRRPEPTMEAPLHDAESPMAIRTKEGKRVPVDVKDPQGPIITASADLPDGTKVEAWGETLSEAAGKLEQQVGDKGTIEATTDLGRAVEAAQKEKATAELREKMPAPRPEEPGQVQVRSPLGTKEEAPSQDVAAVRDQLARAEEERRTAETAVARVEEREPTPYTANTAGKDYKKAHREWKAELQSFRDARDAARLRVRMLEAQLSGMPTATGAPSESFREMERLLLKKELGLKSVSAKRKAEMERRLGELDAKTFAAPDYTKPGAVYDKMIGLVRIEETPPEGLAPRVRAEILEQRADALKQILRVAKERRAKVEYVGNEVRLYRSSRDPEAGVMLNPAEMIRRLIFGRGERKPREPRDLRKNLNRELDVVQDQIRFNTRPSNSLNRGLRQAIGGIEQRIGPHAHRIILKHVADKEAAMGNVERWLYDKETGILRGIRKGSDVSHDIFVAANKPHDAEGKVRQEEAKARLEAKGMGPRIAEMKRGLEAARRLIARRGKAAEDMREDIRDLRESIDETRQKMNDPEWLSKMPKPLAEHLRKKTELAMVRWEADLATKRKALADHIKNWGITEDYMHRVWSESMTDNPGARRIHEELARTSGITSVGFRGLKHRVGKTGYIEDAVVSLGHYYAGLVRKVHYDRIIRDINRLMEGEWRSVGKPYSNDKGEPVDPLSFVKVGQQYRYGGDTVRIKDVERSESGDVTGVQVQVVGAGDESTAHPAEWLVPDQARLLRSRRGGWKEQAALAKNNYLGWHSSGGNPDFIKNWEKLKDEMAHGSKHLQVDSVVDHIEYLFNAGKNLFVHTLLRNPLAAAVKTMPLNVYQNTVNAVQKIGVEAMLRGFRLGQRAMRLPKSEEAWLVRDSGVVTRAASKMDLTQERGSTLMPSEGLRGATEKFGRAWGYVYDKGNEFSGASIYLGAYHAMRPKGRAYQEGAPSHEEAKAYARGVVEHSLGVYDSLMAPQVVKTKWARLFFGMKGYTMRMVGQYMAQQYRAAMQKDASGNRDWRALRRLMATATAASMAVGFASQLIPKLWGADTEGTSVSNKLGVPVHELPWLRDGVRAVEDAVEKATGGWRPTALMRSITIPFFQANLFDKGPGPDILEHIYDMVGADSDRKREALAKAIGKELHSAVPYAAREWMDATANDSGGFTTYDAGSVFAALWPYVKRDGAVMDKAVSQTDLVLRMIAGTPVRDILQRESAARKKEKEDQTRGQHADTLDMILDYVDAQKQGRSTPEQMDAIRERIRQQGSMPDRGQLQRLAQLRSMGREGRLLFQGTKEARAQAIQDYALLKGHDPQMLRMAIGELFKERGGLSPETVEKVRALVK